MELGTLGTFGFALSSPHCVFMLSSIINSWLNNSLYIYIPERGIKLWLCAEVDPLQRQRDLTPWLSQLQPEEGDRNLHTGSKQFGSGLQ